MKKRKLGLFPKVLIGNNDRFVIGAYSPGCHDQNIQDVQRLLCANPQVYRPLARIGPRDSFRRQSGTRCGKDAAERHHHLLSVYDRRGILRIRLFIKPAPSLSEYRRNLRLCTGRKSIPTLFQYQIPSDLRHTDGPPLVIHAQCRHHFHQSLGIEEGL